MRHALSLCAPPCPGTPPRALRARFMPLPYVTDAERYLVRRNRAIPGVYRVVARYGYMEDVEHGWVPGEAWAAIRPGVFVVG